MPTKPKSHVIKPSGRQVVQALDVSPDGEHLVLGHGGLSIWSLQTLERLHEFKNDAGESVLMARWSPDGGTVAFTDTKLRLRLYDVEQREARGVNLQDKKLEWVDYARRRNRLLAAGSRTQVWDGDAEEVVWALPSEGKRRKSPALGCLSPDGKLAAVAGAEAGVVVLYEVDSGKELQRFEGAPDAAHWVGFDPKTRFLAVTELHAHGTFLWNVKTGKRHLQELFDEESEGYWSFRFDPSGTRLALGTLLGMVQVFSLKDGELVFDDQEHRGRIWDIAFTPDGRQLVSGGDDYTARVRALP